MPDCEVCCEKFNLSTRKEVKCKSCDYSICTECAKRYLTSCTKTPHCMKCSVAWTREFMCNSFTKKFVDKDYSVHRQGVLFDIQKSMMPATQAYVEILREVDKIRAKKDRLFEKLTDTQKKMYDENDSLESARRVPEIDMEGIKFILKSKQQLFAKTQLYEEKIRNCDYLIQLYLNPNRVAAQTSQRREFVKPCPADNCRGFLSTKWKCGLCDTNVCNACHEIKKDDVEHVCKEENVETVRMMSKETKNCPKCGVITFKISGCAQIWCTECHTAWSWSTGKVETGVIHNPHYYEYLRRNGGNVPRAIGDVPCGGMPDWWQLRLKLAKIMEIQETRPQYNYNIQNANISLDPVVNEKNKILTTLEQIHRATGHIERVTIPFYTVTPTDHREERAHYMLGKRTEENFKTYLSRYERNLDKANDIRMIIQTYVAITTDLMQRMDRVTSFEEIKELMKEFKEIRAYTNANMMPVSKYYHCVVPCIFKGNWMPVNESAFPRKTKQVVTVNEDGE